MSTREYLEAKYSGYYGTLATDIIFEETLLPNTPTIKRKICLVLGKKQLPRFLPKNEVIVAITTLINCI